MSALALALLGGLLIVVSMPSGGAPQPPLAADTPRTTPMAGPQMSAAGIPGATGAGTTGGFGDGAETSASSNDVASEVTSAPTRPASPISGRQSVVDPQTTAIRRAGGTIGAIESPLRQGLVMPRSIPVSIQIPSIGVQSHLLQLGLNDDGTVQVPPLNVQPSQAGWYKYSPTPGEIGPSVILGHVDSAKHGPAVFFRLGALQAGDRVLVHRSDGSTAIFRVERDVRYSKAGFPTEEVYGNIDHAGLRLITCGGSFDFSSGHYEDNVVVYATLIGAKP